MDSKRYNIRMPGELFTRITRYCARNGLYINGWIVESLYKAVGEAEKSAESLSSTAGEERRNDRR